jgi:hypothetical protein
VPKPSPFPFTASDAMSEAVGISKPSRAAVHSAASDGLGMPRVHSPGSLGLGSVPIAAEAMAAVLGRPGQPSEGFPGLPACRGLERLRQPRTYPGSLGLGSVPRVGSRPGAAEAMAAVLSLPAEAAEGFPCLPASDGLERLRQPRTRQPSRAACPGLGSRPGLPAPNGDHVPGSGTPAQPLGAVPQIGDSRSRTGDTTRIGDSRSRTGDAGIKAGALPENARPYPGGPTRLPENACLPGRAYPKGA